MEYYKFCSGERDREMNLGKAQPVGCHLYLRYSRLLLPNLMQSNSFLMNGHAVELYNGYELSKIQLPSNKSQLFFFVLLVTTSAFASNKKKLTKIATTPNISTTFPI